MKEDARSGCGLSFIICQHPQTGTIEEHQCPYFILPARQTSGKADPITFLAAVLNVKMIPRQLLLLGSSMFRILWSAAVANFLYVTSFYLI